MSPEPSLEPSKELEIIDMANLAQVVFNAGHVTAEYVDAFRILHNMQPPRANIGRIAKSAKEMIDSYPIEILMDAAHSCAASGHANLSAAMTWITAEKTREEQKSNKGASAFLRLAQDTTLE
jgi:hypothetical protein